MLQHGRRAAAQEQLERVRELERDAVGGEYFGKTPAAQHLAVDEDAIAIEDDQVGSALVMLHRNIRSYAHSESNSSALNGAAPAQIEARSIIYDGH